MMSRLCWGHVGIMLESVGVCWGQTSVMSGSFRGHVRVMSGSCQGQVEVISELSQGCAAISSQGPKMFSCFCAALYRAGFGKGAGRAAALPNFENFTISCPT